MRNAFLSESLENRRLFATYALDIDQSLSTLTASGTVNGFAIGADDLTTQIDGTINVSNTLRGIKFISGSEVTIATSTNANQSFVFQVAGGRTISIGDFASDFTSSRIPVDANGRFNTRRVTTSVDDAAVIDSGATVANFSGSNVRLAYGIGRVRTAPGALRIEVPFTFTVTTTYTANGSSQSLNLTATGQLVARTVDGASGSSFAGSTAIVDAEKEDETPGVADDVLG